MSTKNETQAQQLLPTTMVGSYPRPLWFRNQLHGRDILDTFKLEELAQAYDDATGAVIRDQERAGLDIVTDGQMYFDDYGGGIGSFVWYWYERLPGFVHSKMEHPLAVSGAVSSREAEALNQWGGTTTDGPVAPGPTRLAWIYRRAAQLTDRPIKVSVGAGPCNLPMHLYYDDTSYYKDPKTLGEDLAPIFRAELQELVAAGARHIQLEDLGAWMPVQSGDFDDSKWVAETINSVVEGIEARISWHFCMGNAYGGPSEMFAGILDQILPPLFDTHVDEFVLDFAYYGMRDVHALRHLPADKSVAAGVIDVRSIAVESPEEVADRIRTVLQFVPAERVTLTTDCGMKSLPRVVAFEKLRTLVRGAEIVRAELTG
jgi:methionine synthase II (cobalamin-independent)